MKALVAAFISSVDSQGATFLLIDGETVRGGDVFGVLIDGTLKSLASGYSLDLTVRVPPGVATLLGAEAYGSAYDFVVKDELPLSFLSDPYVKIRTEQGSVNVRFILLRNLD